MNPQPHSVEPLALGNGPSIQPVDPGAEFARQAAALERLAGDIELVNRLMWAQYGGPEWRMFRTALAEYGVAVIYRWILSGRIFRECAKKGFGALPPRRQHDDDDARGIAGETVARAFVFFRDKVLIRGVWDPARGASIRTYFIGACILHFPDEYRRSLGGERLATELVAAEESELELARSHATHFSRPDARVELASQVRAIGDPKTREVLLSRTEGYSEQEIADRVSTSRKAVETRLYRLRQKNPWNT